MVTVIEVEILLMECKEISHVFVSVAVQWDEYVSFSTNKKLRRVAKRAVVDVECSTAWYSVMTGVTLQILCG